MSKVSVTTVGDSVLVEGLFLYHWFDRYDWDDGKYVQPIKDVPLLNRTVAKNFKIEDEDIGILAENGKAKNFWQESLWSESFTELHTLDEWKSMAPVSVNVISDAELKELLKSSLVVDVSSNDSEGGG